MRRALILLLLPIWLLAGWQGFVQPSYASAKTHKEKEPKVGKVEAAPVSVVQVQAPQGDLWLPQLPSPGYGRVPVDHEVLPLRASRMRPVPGFAQRFIRTTIALRAP